MKESFSTVFEQPVHRYTLENEKIKIVLTDFGARIISCVLKENNQDIMQGFDHPQGYVEDVRYMGAAIGRVANRIGKGHFTLNGTEYSLPINNNGNTLHGGLTGLDFKIFDAEETQDSVVFRCHLNDGEDGFPGNMDVTVTYRLLEDGWAFDTEAISDQDTLCSITNHAFFNMNGQESETAMNHLVQIEADYFSPVDKEGLTLDEMKEVKGTPFDFTSPKLAGKEIDAEDEDLACGSGYDHNFILKEEGLKKAVVVEGDAGIMTILTTLPCLQFYSSNFLGGTSKGKNGASYPYRSSLCFEPQYFPNAIQYSNHQKPILLKGEVQKHTTEYHYEAKGH